LRPFCDSCGRPEPSLRDADEALVVRGELTLGREAGAGGDLRQGQVASQELLGPLDAAHDDVVVQRQPNGRLELPREVVDAEMGDGSQLLPCQAGLEVFLHVLDDGAEPRLGERAVPPARWLAGCQDVPEQVDGQMTGACSIRYCARRSDDTNGTSLSENPYSV
jgi:hypothetical protein